MVFGLYVCDVVCVMWYGVVCLQMILCSVYVMCDEGVVCVWCDLCVACV